MHLPLLVQERIQYFQIGGGGGQKIMCAPHTSRARSTKSLAARVRLTLIRLGGGMMAPLDISRDNSATRKVLYDNFLSSFEVTVPKLRNFLYMHVGPKKAQNVILCTTSMQIGISFSHLVHQNMLIFTLNG